ncbi:hypothetical protein AAHE18_17G157000 [Arachis hypogaea]
MAPTSLMVAAATMILDGIGGSLSSTRDNSSKCQQQLRVSLFVALFFSLRAIASIDNSSSDGCTRIVRSKPSSFREL